MSTFGISTRIFFGTDRHEGLHEYIAGRALERISAIVDGAVARLAAVEHILDGFQMRGYKVADKVPLLLAHEPSYEDLDTFVAPYREDPPDLILAIGGGSVIDMAKGVAALVRNPGRAVDYRGMHKVKNSSVPLVAYPTTAGTGTEVTWTASFIDGLEQRKLGINGNNVAPLCGVLNPELVASCPRSVTLSAGLDTMVHAIEAITARSATPITVGLGAKAFALIYDSLPQCLDNQPSLNAWEQAQFAAYFAGIAMMNAGGGPASGISYPLGVHYGVPHGLAGGVFLPHVFAYNVEAGYRGYTAAYNQLPDADQGLDDDAKNRDFVRKFDAFYRRIGGPTDLKPWNCAGPQAAEQLAKLTWTQRRENLDLNPVPFGQAELESILSKVCS